MSTFDLTTLSKQATEKARTAAGLMFFINGSAFATWASRIPAIQEKLQLGPGLLGVALLMMAVGALTAMCFAGRWIEMRGSATVTVAAMVGALIFLSVVAFSGNLVALCLLVGVFGLLLGTMDVAMNSHAVVVERAYQRSIMSGFHAQFSLGGIFGSTMGAIMAHFAIKPEIHFALCAVFLALLGAYFQKSLLSSQADKNTSTESSGTMKNSLAHFARSKRLIALSTIMFCCFLIEGAVGDWSGVYLKGTLMADAGTAALAYASFSVLMTGGRFCGDWLNETLGKTMLVVGGSALALVGLLLIILFSNAWLAIAGFALIGLGVSNIVPIAFTAAGNVSEIPTGSAIATVALIGYFGLLAGPPIIGFTAELITLRLALLLLGALLVTMIVMAKWVKREVRINASDAVDEIK